MPWNSASSAQIFLRSAAGQGLVAVYANPDARLRDSCGPKHREELSLCGFRLRSRRTRSRRLLWGWGVDTILRILI